MICVSPTWHISDGQCLIMSQKTRNNLKVLDSKDEVKFGWLVGNGLGTFQGVTTIDKNKSPLCILNQKSIIWHWNDSQRQTARKQLCNLTSQVFFSFCLFHIKQPERLHTDLHFISSYHALDKQHSSICLCTSLSPKLFPRLCFLLNMSADCN